MKESHFEHDNPFNLLGKLDDKGAFVQEESLAPPSKTLTFVNLQHLVCDPRTPPKMSKYLLFSTSLNAQDEEGNTLLHHAFKKKAWHLIKLLLRHGAQILPNLYGLYPTDFQRNKDGSFSQDASKIIKHFKLTTSLTDNIIENIKARIRHISFPKTDTQSLKERFDYAIATIEFYVNIPFRRMINIRYPWFELCMSVIFQHPDILTYLTRSFPGCALSGELLLESEYEKKLYMRIAKNSTVHRKDRHFLLYRAYKHKQNDTFYNSGSITVHIWPHLKDWICCAKLEKHGIYLLGVIQNEESQKISTPSVNSLPKAPFHSDITFMAGLYGAQRHCVAFLAFYSQSRHRPLLVLTFNTGSENHRQTFERALGKHHKHHAINFLNLQTAQDDENCSLFAAHFLKATIEIIKEEHPIIQSITHQAYQSKSLTRKKMEPSYKKLKTAIKKKLPDYFQPWQSDQEREEALRRYHQEFRWKISCNDVLRLKNLAESIEQAL